MMCIVFLALLSLVYMSVSHALWWLRRRWWWYQDSWEFPPFLYVL